MATALLTEIAEPNLVPIREISRVTGVNTVTLRAWERRYGLLVPLRTSKGHRLYTHDDVQRVQEIQLWLSRGVAISKVKALLAQKKLHDCIEEIDSVWEDLAAQIYQHINAFHRPRLEHVLSDVFALYPVDMVADYLLVPLIKGLQGNALGQAAQHAFFFNVLQEHLQAAIYRQRQVAHGEKVLLVSLPCNPLYSSDLESLLINYNCLVHQFQAEYLGHLDLKEAQLCAEALHAKIIVLVGYGALNATELQLHLTSWREKNAMPIVLAGNLASLYPALGLDKGAAVHPCATMQQIQATINQLVKG
ncbi:MerR family transcriptional regulator [Cellvibrio mixtus]|uniref:MerR family transcriptional regulator n=1 Tax=Cellvibrio mixtus TaxID=39650 RepID=UPI0006941D3B|nr:MerR family transcriptional regulator [Cellvibrio mixtus]